MWFKVVLDHRNARSNLSVALLPQQHHCFIALPGMCVYLSTSVSNCLVVSQDNHCLAHNYLALHWTVKGSESNFRAQNPHTLIWEKSPPWYSNSAEIGEV